MKRTCLLSLLFAALTTISCTNTADTKNEEAVSFDQVLTTRRSVRSYDASKTISREEIKTLLTKTQEAPSWANQQPSKYYVALSEDKVNAVRELIGPNKERTAGAPVFIVSTFERDKSGFFNGEATNELGNYWGAYDNGLSNAYLILQARAMGFDTLIMGMRDADGLRELFSIPENESIVAVIALGYRADEPNQPGHRELDEILKIF